MPGFLSNLLGRWRLIPLSSAVGLLGMALLAFGAYLLLPAAGFIVGGVLLILAAADMRM